MKLLFHDISDKKFRIIYNNSMNDQINSTRIVTDDIGNVVYSAAHGPYGEPLKTWTNTYDPNPKFSGKEREGYTRHDYFGARYYDNSTFRFISVDPVRNRDAAIANPQLWNLYAYCGNNPITYFDPDGRYIFKSIGNWWKSTPLSHFLKGDFKGGLRIAGENIAKQLDDPTFVLGFVGGVKFKAGRVGRTNRLLELLKEKQPRHIKGWIRQELNEIARKKKTHIRNPKGYELAHKRGFEARKGFGYKHSKLRTKKGHKIQHKVDGYK